MSKSALLDILPDRRRKLIYHEEDGKTYIETRQDAGPLIEAAKILADIPPRKEDGWRFMCVIDDATYNRSIAEGWFHDKAAWRKWMNDSDNRAFNGGRTSVS